MNKHCTGWIFNTKQLQSIAGIYCEFYCCFYCILRCRGFDLIRIVNLFGTDTGINDSIVHGFVCDISYKWVLRCPRKYICESTFTQLQFMRSQHLIEPSVESRSNTKELVQTQKRDGRDLPRHDIAYQDSDEGRGSRSKADETMLQELKALNNSDLMCSE